MCEVSLEGRWIAGLSSSLFDVRRVPDNEWENLGLKPMADTTGGQAARFPTQLVECPEGHQRRVTHDEHGQLEFPCGECGRVYQIDWDRPPRPPY